MRRDLTPSVNLRKLGTLPQNEVESLAEVRARSLRTQQRVTCQCQYPVLGIGLAAIVDRSSSRRIPLVEI